MLILTIILGSILNKYEDKIEIQRNKNYQVFGGMTLNIYILYGIIYNIKIYCKLNIIFIKVRQLKLPKEQFCDETQYLYYITRTQNRIGQTINTNR